MLIIIYVLDNVKHITFRNTSSFENTPDFQLIANSMASFAFAAVSTTAKYRFSILFIFHHTSDYKKYYSDKNCTYYKCTYIHYHSKTPSFYIITSFSFPDYYNQFYSFEQQIYILINKSLSTLPNY